MKQIYAFENKKDYERFQDTIENWNQKLMKYRQELEKNML